MRRRIAPSLPLLAGVLLVGGAPPAAADSVRGSDPLTAPQVVSVFPSLEGASRFVRRPPFTAPDPERCSQTVTPRTTGRRDVSFLERMGQDQGPFVEQRVARFATAGQAARAVRLYRVHAERCAGRSRTGNPVIGVTTTTLRTWKGLPWDGRGKVATLTRSSTSGYRSWTGRTVARVGRTVTVVDVTRDDGMRPDKADSVALHRLAVTRLRR